MLNNVAPYTRVEHYTKLCFSHVYNISGFQHSIKWIICLLVMQRNIYDARVGKPKWENFC